MGRFRDFHGRIMSVPGSGCAVHHMLADDKNYVGVHFYRCTSTCKHCNPRPEEKKENEQ